MPKFKDRTGETNIANNGQKMTIIAYRNCDDIDIQFEDGTIVYNKTHQLFKNGTVKNPNVHITEYGAYKGKAKKCVVFGVEYESFKKACETYGINDDNARAYRDKYKISDEKAIDHYVNGTDYSTTEKK